MNSHYVGFSADRGGRQLPNPIVEFNSRKDDQVRIGKQTGTARPCTHNTHDRVRYTMAGAPITGENSLETSFGTLLTD